jgi:hypothetical protein
MPTWPASSPTREVIYDFGFTIYDWLASQIVNLKSKIQNRKWSADGLS